MNKRLSKHFGMQSSGDWRNEVESLKAAREEYRQFAGMMTEYEKTIIERDIKAQAERVYPVVSAGAIGEWKGAIRKYQEAGQSFDREVTKEIARWDAGRLNTELQTVQSLVALAIQGGGGNALDGSPGVAAKLEAMYAEAVQSGDMYKQRATYEILLSVLPKVSGDDRMPVNRLVKQSEKDLNALRVTDGMIAAKETQAQTVDELMRIRDELIDVSTALGEGDPTNPLASGAFTKALRMVQQDAQTGEIRIFAETDGEVTGVFWPEE